MNLSAANGRGRNCARRGGRAQERCERAAGGCGVGKRQPVPQPPHACGDRAQKRCERAAMGCGVRKRRPVPPPHACGDRAQERRERAGLGARCGKRGHGMWGEEAPARPSAAHVRGGRAQERCERAGLGARCGKRGDGRRAMAVRPGGSARPPAAAARPLPRPHGASLKVPRQRAKTARGRRIRRSRACHSHCLRAVCVSPASRAPGAPCSRSPHRRSRRARRSRPAPATARWYGNGS